MTNCDRWMDHRLCNDDVLTACTLQFIRSEEELVMVYVQVYVTTFQNHVSDIWDAGKDNTKH